MLRSIGFAVLVASGLGGAMLAAPQAHAAAMQPAGARAAIVGAVVSQVTPVWHYGRPHYGRYKRPVRSCRVVWKRVWTRYGTRRVQTRVCRVW